MSALVPAAAAAHQGCPLQATPQLEIFPQLPAWCSTVHAARDDRNAPLIQAGEILIIEGGDRAGWYPIDGQLFLVEYETPPCHGYLHPIRSREIGQTFLNSRGDWHIGALRRGQVGRTIFCCDGPYRDEGYLSSKLIGKVVGLYGPSMKGRANR
jgi:hypothetical protein